MYAGFYFIQLKHILILYVYIYIIYIIHTALYRNLEKQISSFISQNCFSSYEPKQWENVL
jgi:hypothetical protein